MQKFRNSVGRLQHFKRGAAVVFFLCTAQAAVPGDASTHGKWFSKKDYTPEPIPTFAESRDRLPHPVLDAHPGWIDMYWKCWEIAFRGIKQPQEDSPLVSNWLDEAFSDNIFQWDTIFMMMFARYGHDCFPAIQSLDNFYTLQRESGYIGREFREADGRIVHYDDTGGLFAESGWKNTVNPPLFAWAEVESYRLTGNKSRFAMVLPVLEKYAEWLNRDGDPDAKDWENNGRISKTAAHKLYWNTPLGSGMDNSPRPTAKGSGWVEMSSQMVIMYNHLAIMAAELGLSEKADHFRKEARAIAARINRWCWNEEDGFYYDVDADGNQFKKMTMGGFWPLLAEVASEKQAERLVGHLQDPQKFWRPMVFPTLAADEPEYDPMGHYWQGGVWAPTDVMVIKGLEKYDRDDFAAEATEKFLAGMYEVFRKNETFPNTVFELYAPELVDGKFSPGSNNSGGMAKPDFVGWTGCGPIQLLIENVMGIRAEGVKHSLHWHLRRIDRHGVQKLKVGGVTVNLICRKRASATDPATVTLSADSPFTVIVHGPRQTRTIRLKPDQPVTVTVQ
jgi:glycogen debranching enzyme